MRKLKIIQILPTLNTGGVERGVLDFNKYLVNKGHDSYVISNGGRQVKNLIEDGGNHIHLQVSKKSIFTLLQAKKLADIINEISPDIVHIRSRIPAWVLQTSKIFLKNPRPIIFSTFHGLYSTPLYSQVMSKVDHMIAISNTVKDYIINTYNVPKNKITTIPRGCEEDVFNQDILPESWLDNWYEEYPHTKDKIILTLPTRISAWKGIDSFIELISMLDGDKFHGLVVGPTSKSKQRYLNNLKDKLSVLGLSTKITFTGSRNDIVNIYKLSDVVFNLSIKPEPFGRTTIEAISCGSKVIGWNHGGTKEILEDLYPSGLVTLNDINELKDRVLEVSKVDYPFPNKNTFTSKKMTEDTLKLYYQLFNRSS